MVSYFSVFVLNFNPDNELINKLFGGLSREAAFLIGTKALIKKFCFS